MKIKAERLSEQGRKIYKKNLINILNYINFQEGTVLINFEHRKYGNIISIKAKPEPCTSETLNCSWIEKKNENFKDYEFLNFIISDGYRLIIVKPELKTINEEGLTFVLPEISYDINSRKVKRYSCENIEVEIIQSGAVFRGKLLNFSTISFCVNLCDIQQHPQYIMLEPLVTVILKEDKNVFYSGKCEIIRKEVTNKTVKIILKPICDNIQIFTPKEIRSLRHKLFPSPSIIFKHPITKKMITLKIEDLSSGGVSVEEYYEESVLLPGLIIPELEIEFTPGFKINCKAQVLYRNIYQTEDGKIIVKCGIVFLDLDIQDQVKISAFLHRAKDERSYVCNRVDLDALWEFFFETGFFYAEKYAFLQHNKERIKKLYEKLYLENPHIARHFIYQDKGKILGHISMLRVYEKTWLFHHHASNAVNFHAGLAVLDQISYYANDFYHLYSTYMNFVICYFRSTNKFPVCVFGGFTKKLNNPKGCSIDNVAYFHFKKNLYSYIMRLQPLNLLGWTLNKSNSEDLLKLESFYEFNSGGLMLDALDLRPDMINIDNLKIEYQKIGFNREKKIFSLKKDGELIAVIMLIVSDIGLNLSNLTSCIHVIVIDSDLLNLKILYFTLSLLSKYYDYEEIPVLVYPLNYLEIQQIPYEKIYNLWVLNPKYSDDFMKHIRKWIRK